MYQANDSRYSNTNTWSTRQEVLVKFVSGYEANEQMGKYICDPSYIIATMLWPDGKITMVFLERWRSTKKIVDENEILFNSRTKERIYSVDGFDEVKRFWEIYF